MLVDLTGACVTGLDELGGNARKLIALLAQIVHEAVEQRHGDVGLEVRLGPGFGVPLGVLGQDQREVLVLQPLGQELGFGFVDFAHRRRAIKEKE